MKIKAPFSTVTIDLSRKGAPNFFFEKVNQGNKRGIKTFLLRPYYSKGAYPNVCVPLAGLIDLFRLKGNSIEYDPTWNVPRYVDSIGLLHPYDNPCACEKHSHLNKIWKYDHNSHYAVVSGIMDSIRTSIPVERGVLSSLELCLNEITDNVLMHSRDRELNLEPIGFVMAQVHRDNPEIALAIYDYGQGIAESLRLGGVSAECPNEFLQLALKRGTGDGKGAGNGLWILDSIIKHGRGSLDVTSSGASYALHHKDDNAPIAKESVVNTPKQGTTLVDFQLNITKPINIFTALEEYIPANLWLEQREDAANPTSCRLLINEEADGFGSRHDAAKLRNMVLNVLRDKHLVILDFKDISFISTSFADEFIAKLVETMGDAEFGQKVKLENLSDTLSIFINAAVSERLIAASRNH